MPKLLTLETWLALTYGDDAPTLNTARRWVREHRIYPEPKKHGRTYFLDPEARYIDPYNKKRTLLEKISGSKTA